MINNWSIHELAVFSVKDFTFGVDASQIKEIVTAKHLELLIDPDDKCPFILVEHNKRPLLETGS